MKKVILSLVLVFSGWALWAQHGCCGGGCPANNSSSSSNSSYNSSYGSSQLQASKPKAAEFKLFPNPSAHYFQVDEASVAEGGAQQFRIFAANGREVASYRLEKGLSYDISGLDAGIYYVRFYNYKGHPVAGRILSKASSAGGL
ncbi:MAG: T9SS type A sorting domain-containing protein [Phaeodactylibacter sp.]|nr:T9SS type A sorting domain-containing protein [Phaeodactylibacter sp.]MCB9276661.1 T9SS type A sorting domain-containing protein [Lewinellaceae bacterium]